MNPHFNIRERGYLDRIPSRAYARLDSVEVGDRNEVTISLDAVAAEGVDSVLARLSPNQWNAAWQDLFDGGRAADRRGLIEAFDKLELAHIEITTSRDRAGQILGSAMPDNPRNGWLELALAPGHGASGLAAMLYAGLFAPGLPTTVLKAGPASSNALSTLRAAFSMESWPIADDDDVESAVAPAAASSWVAYDVGQGSANALLDEDGIVDLMHDIGCGVYANAKTRPFGRVLCHSRPANIVLSHWDTDHWAGARYFAPLNDGEAFLRRTWIVPFDATIGPRHIAFATDILSAGGCLLVVRPSPWQSPWMTLADGRRARLTRGDGPDRNGSGLVLDVHDVASGGRWLLTGDVDYAFVKGSLASSYVAMSVPHHGAKRTGSGPCPPPTPSQRYARLVYSFGHDNTFHHPTATCMDEHAAVGWNHGAWYPTRKATVVAGGQVVATACNPNGPGHLESIEIGWAHPPAVPHPPACGGARCNVKIGQS